MLESQNGKVHRSATTFGAQHLLGYHDFDRDTYSRGRNLAFAAFGPEIKPVFTGHQIASPEKMAVLDSSLSSWLNRVCRLPKNTDTRSFLAAQLRRADEYPVYLSELIEGPFGTRFRPLNEVLDHSDHPFEMLYDIFSRRASDRYVSEIVRKYYLTLFAALSSAKKLRDGVTSGLDSVKRTLDEYLFEGRYGEVYPLDVFSLHDNDTNRAIAVRQHPGELPSGHNAHIKEHRAFPIRFIRRHYGSNLPPVAYFDRGKSENSNITKILEKVLRTGMAPQRVIQEIQDNLGLKFVVLGDRQQRDDVARIVTDALYQASQTAEFKVDNSTDGKAGQTKKVDFYRLIAQLTNPSASRRKTRLELQFLTGEAHLDTLYETGRFNPDKGMYDGRAHKLLELRRLMRGEGMALGIAEWMFPERIYFPEGDHIEALLIDRQHELAATLKNESEVRDPEELMALDY